MEDKLSEAGFQSLVLEAVRALGLQAYHTYDSRRSQPGFPDLVIVGAFGVIYRELKTSTGKLSEHQKYWLQILQDAGADVRVWHPVDWPDAVMRELRLLGRVKVPVPARKPGRVVPVQRSW